MPHRQMFPSLDRMSANNTIRPAKSPCIDVHLPEEQLWREYRGLVTTLILNKEKYYANEP